MAALVDKFDEAAVDTAEDCISESSPSSSEIDGATGRVFSPEVLIVDCFFDAMGPLSSLERFSIEESLFDVVSVDEGFMSFKAKSGAAL